MLCPALFSFPPLSPPPHLPLYKSFASADKCSESKLVFSCFSSEAVWTFCLQLLKMRKRRRINARARAALFRAFTAGSLQEEKCRKDARKKKTKHVDIFVRGGNQETLIRNNKRFCAQNRQEKRIKSEVKGDQKKFLPQAPVGFFFDKRVALKGQFT